MFNVNQTILGWSFSTEGKHKSNKDTFFMGITCSGILKCNKVGWVVVCERCDGITALALVDILGIFTSEIGFRTSCFKKLVQALVNKVILSTNTSALNPL